MGKRVTVIREAAEAGATPRDDIRPFAYRCRADCRMSVIRPILSPPVMHVVPNAAVVNVSNCPHGCLGQEG